MPLESVLAAKAIPGKPELQVREWPAGQATLFYQLDDAAFLPGASIVVTCECSWDGGQTWPYRTEDPFVGGAKSRSGAPPSVTLGPFREADGADPLNGRISNPTHVRLSIVSARGLPVCGLSMRV